MTRDQATLVSAVLLSLCGCGGSGGNNSTALTNIGAGGNLATAAPGVASGTEWGVWASAAGGNFSDPCAIQYVGAQVEGNRYDANPSYVRVRTRATQPEADLDIDHFGRYHRDQPDGVVKMTPCEADEVSATGTSSGGNTSATSGGVTTGGVPNLAGVWRGGNGQGSTYTFSQNGNAIRWTRSDNDEIGTATVTGNQISASYQSSQGYGSASGTITLDSSGRAVKIDWGNGDSYIRQ
jgi:hypothetical protein